MYFSHSYYTVKDYNVIKYYDDGSSRVMDPHNEIEWVALGNVPVIESGNRFIIVKDGEVTEDPNKSAILAAEAAAIQAEKDAIAAKEKSISDAKAAISVISAEVDKATTIAGLKIVINEILKHVIVLTDSKAE